MKKLKELVGVAEEPHLTIQEYHKTLEEMLTNLINMLIGGWMLRKITDITFLM